MVLTTEQQAVAETNDAFYDALTRRDLTAMERLWFPADWVECVHPGMASIRGWDAVRESWALLFSAPGTLLVAATDVFVRHDGAWRMAVHHASAVPFLAPPEVDGATTVN
jgi:limonene-1,2-epoxide hydrolase